MVKEIFQGSGSENAEADLVAEYLVRANLCGVDSHGVIRVPDYVQMVEAGTLKPNVQPKVVSERGATARLDAGFGYGQVSGKFAMELAIRKAKEYGTGTVVVFNGNHVGRVADYPALAASEDMIGVMMVKAYGELVAPWGGRKGLLATSPISFAIPTGTHGQIVGDFATSASAEGKVRVRQARGEKVPTGWLLDSQGKPTVEPDDLYNGGSLLTFGQWKGYALNLLMEATGGALSGAGVLDAFTGLNGVFAQAVDISFFSEVGEFKSRMDTMVEKILRSPPADGVKEVLIPGDPEAREMEKRKVNGIPVEERTWARLVDVARKYGVDVPRVG
ncbi:MAG: Ldh family oxidoreductase [Nitrososphaerota archaeon]|nr:Ldh family oxidoreductase [Nitrososphaerota archaeon]